MRVLCVLALCVTAWSTSLNGHHSFAAYYFEDQSITIDGTVVELDYRSPHAWVHVATTDENGTQRRYAAEWANPSRLSQRGVTKDTIRPGDRVIITGSPSRDANDFRLHLKTIQRPADGWTWVGRGLRTSGFRP